MSKSIQSIIKASKILDLILNESRHMGISDFSRHLNMPKATIQNMVFTLEQIGYIEKDPMTMKYRLGPVLFQMGMHYANNMDLTIIARVWLEKLCAEYNESARAGIMMGEKVIVVMEIDPDNSYIAFPGPGSVIPAHTSAIGKILLAYMPDKRRNRIIENYTFTPLTEKSITTAAGLEVDLDDIRKKGIAFDREESLKGLTCVAGPVFNHKEECIASISLSGNTERIESRLTEIINAVKYVSRRVSEQMGCRNAGFA
jgi:DNA-binding IclR family transcriptional regulator